MIPVGRIDAALTLCLEALSRQTLPREQFEIIVVADGVRLPSDVPTAGTRVCQLETTSGRSAARNCGLAHARGIAAVSLDADMVASADMLRHYYDAHRQGSVACVGVREFARGTSPIVRYPRADYREGFYAATDYLRNAAEPFRAFSTCNCSYPLATARRVGLFDEQMQGWGLEDIEFGYRLWKSGEVEFRYVSGAVATHIDHERDKVAEQQTWAANRDYCIRKHGEVFAAGRGTPLLIGTQASSHR